MKSHRTDFSNLTQLKQSKHSENNVFIVHLNNSNMILVSNLRPDQFQ